MMESEAELFTYALASTAQGALSVSKGMHQVV